MEQQQSRFCNKIIPGSYWVITSILDEKIVFFTGALSFSSDFSLILDVGVELHHLHARKFSLNEYDLAVNISKQFPSYDYFTWDVKEINIDKYGNSDFEY